MNKTYKSVVKIRKFTAIGALCIGGLILISIAQLPGKGYATDTFVGNQGGYAGASQTVVAVQDIAPDKAIAEQIRDLPQSPPEGVPAITPPLDEARVSEYLANNPLNIGGTDVTKSNMQVTRVQFITMGELKKLLNNDPLWDSWPAGEPVIYVTYKGTFTFYDMDGVEHVYPAAYRVFHGLTGNELQAGTMLAGN